MEDRHIVAIDLGSSKFALTVAKINGDDIQVIYYREIPSDGIRNSYAYNSMKISKALEPLVRDAEKELSIKITQAVVGMPKFRVRQETGTARNERNADECITESEINELKASALNTYPLEDTVNEKLFGAVAQSFSNGEDFQLVENEIIGMPSGILEGNFKIFIGKSTPLHYVDVAFNKLGIAVARKYFTPEPVAKAVLTGSEMENGVALIDFGGGSTSVSVYYGSIMRHYASIPFGGNAITSDIKTECMISDALAENIKKAFGACMPDRLQNLSEKTIQINDEATAMTKQLPVKYLSEIISYRVKEIIEAILFEIEQSGFADNLRSGLVLTRGCAELTNCCNYIKELSGYTVRKGYPRHLFSTGSSGCNGVFETSAAVSIGLVLTAQNDHVLDCIEGENTINAGIEVVLGGGEASVPDTGHENDGEAGAEPEPVQEPDKIPGNGTLFPDGEVPVVKPGGGKNHGRNTGGKAGDKGGGAGNEGKTVKNPPIWTKVKNLFTDYYNDLTKE